MTSDRTPFDAAALDALVGSIEPASEEHAGLARSRHDGLAKPPGSLGMVEDVGVRLAGIQRACPPAVPSRPVLVVAAGDHGVHAEGVTPWPQAITAAMAGVIADGRAASSVMAEGFGVEVVVLDVGCADPVPADAGVRAVRVVDGTRNLRVEDALTPDECLAAIAAGHDAAIAAIQDGADLLLLGDMGIANTTASAALVGAFTGASADEVTGRGTGIDDATLDVKTKVVADALSRLGGARLGSHRSPLEVLAAVGGAEHAALVGVVLAGASRRVPVVADGVITNAACLAAVALAPAAVDHLIAAHRSVEPGATIALDHLGLEPLLDLHLRLGEGTGALLAVPIIQAACRVLSRMASLEDLQ